MRYFLIITMMTMLLACSKNEDESKTSIVNKGWEGFDCVMKDDNTLTIDRVNQNIIGKWRLEGMITQLTLDTVPDIYMIIGTKINDPEDAYVASIFKDNVLLGYEEFKFKIETFEQTNYVLIVNEKLTIGNTTEYNFLNGSIRICPEELLIDNGMASDGPGYLFRKQ